VLAIELDNYKDKLETETDDERLKVFRAAKDLVESLIDEARIEMKLVPESEGGKRKSKKSLKTMFVLDL
jgi:hypothetical protein